MKTHVGAGSPRLRLCRLLLTLLLVLAAQWGGAPAPVNAQACNLSGTWSSDFGTLQLTQNGANVTGSYSNNFGPGSLSGTVTGSSVSGRWNSADGHNGGFKWTVKSCTSFGGSWNEVGDCCAQFNGTRTSGPTPTPPPSNPPTPTAPPGPTGALGGMDLSGYCQAGSSLGIAGLFDGAALLDDGNWYCVVGNALDSGYDVAASIDDMNAVCRWQYNRDDAYASQTAAGDPRSWLCYAGSGGTATTPANPPALSTPASPSTLPSSTGCGQWSVSGDWTFQQPNATGTFSFSQNGGALSGSARTSGGNGPLTGTVTGDQIDFVVSWSTNSGPVQGRYAGTITSGAITGQTYPVANPLAGTSWNATGPTDCIASASPGPPGSANGPGPSGTTNTPSGPGPLGAANPPTGAGGPLSPETIPLPSRSLPPDSDDPDPTLF